MYKHYVWDEEVNRANGLGLSDVNDTVTTMHPVVQVRTVMMMLLLLLLLLITGEDIVVVHTMCGTRGSTAPTEEIEV
jgi:hypothetical protein